MSKRSRVQRWNEISDNLRWCYRKTDVGLTDEADSVCYTAFVVFDARSHFMKYIEKDLCTIADLGDMLLT